ncbi:hypothetical protein B7463_g9906, partial [Scytalidium lignicola]
MPFIPHTPESLIQRSDSKNPALTCCGVTSNGRPCRRPLGKPRLSLPGHDNSGNPSEFGYCWQHMDQAGIVNPCGVAHPGLEHTTIKERTSIDTLVDRLGLIQVDPVRSHSRKRPTTKQSTSREAGKTHRSHSHQGHHRPRPKQKSDPGMLFCCTGVPDDGKRTPPRPAVKVQRGRTSVPIPKQPPMQQTKARPAPPTAYLSPQTGNAPDRPLFSGRSSSQTTELLSLISKSATPKTAAMLLTELSKPISEQDEAGYIYMFWLTPESLSSTLPSEVASSLLEPTARPRPGQRRTSEVLQTFSTPVDKSTNSDQKKTMLLKIGRAQNVQRRLNQWTRQCGYNISLIRYYPYNPSSSGSSPGQVSTTPRKVPCVHKVERLIHIELNEKRIQSGEKCSTCGKEHREWFNVGASKDGVKEVDYIIRKWVDWGEMQV